MQTLFGESMRKSSLRDSVASAKVRLMRLDAVYGRHMVKRMLTP